MKCGNLKGDLQIQKTIRQGPPATFALAYALASATNTVEYWCEALLTLAFVWPVQHSDISGKRRTAQMLHNPCNEKESLY